MAFWRKSKNRKFTRRHVLDVKLRSDQIRASRMRLAAIMLGMVFGTILGFYVIWRSGEFVLDRMIYQNRSFTISEIEVQTDGRLPKDELRRWSGVKTGENLLSLDLTRVKRDLEMVPVIRNVAVERILPHTLRLRVNERVPLADVHLVQPGSGKGNDLGVLQLDRDGFVMTLIGPSTAVIGTNAAPDTGLPLIIGIDAREFIPGRQIKSEAGRHALQLLDAFQHSAMTAHTRIQSIDITSSDVLIVRALNGSLITFADQGVRDQLLRWQAVADVALQTGRTIATLDLSVSNNPPTVFIDPSAPPATPSHTRNPRKRNV